MKIFISLVIICCLSFAQYPCCAYAAVDTTEISIEKFTEELTELNEQYDDEPVSNRLIVKSKYNINELDSVDIVEGYEDLHVVQFDNSESADEAFEYYNSSKLIEYAEPDIPMTACDFDYNSHLSWGSDSIGIDDYFGYLEDVENLPEIVVGVIDTGIELDHDFLRNRIIQTGINFSDSGDSNSENDDNGHGTHCAGIIVDNTLDNVKIEGYKVLNNEGSGNTTSIISAIYSAIENDVDVISMSLGGRGTSSAMQDAVNEAFKKNITVCAAAGNEGADASKCVPANLNGVITVAAHNDEDEVPYWSNWGDVVDVIAPGIDIESSYIGNTYTNLSGTSMATPFVAAASASLKSYNQNYKAEDILNIINDNARSYNGISERFKDKPIIYLGNIDGYKERTPSPVFMTEPGVYESSITVELSCEDTNASIYYTTDGSRPAYNNSILYTEPFAISSCSVVRAYAISEGKFKSPVAKAEYDIVTEDDESNFTINEEGIITAYNGSIEYLKIPDMVNNTIVTGLGYSAFAGKGIRAIDLPDTVKSIGERAFGGCQYLKSINFKRVETVGKFAFRKCTNLEKVTSNTNYTVDEATFAYCDKLVSIDTSKLKNTSKDLFYECRSLTEFINENVTEIAENCFYRTKGLIYVNVPNIETVNKKAFDLSALEIIKAPKLKTVNSYGFDDCYYLKEIDFPELERVYGARNFARCGYASELYRINLPKLSGEITNYCFECIKTPVIQLDNITEIGIGSFYFCTIEKIILKNVVSLPNQAFNYANCSSVLFLPKVETVIDRALGNCKAKLFFLPSLVEASWLPTDEKSNTFVFSNNFKECKAISGGTKQCTIIAPKGSYADELAHIETPDGDDYNVNRMVFIDSDSMVTAKGASIRLKDNGFRFGFSWNEIHELNECADDIKYGFEYAYDETEDLNKDKKATNRVYHPEDNNTTFNLVFTSVPKTSFETVISARAYVNIDGMIFKSPILQRSFSGVAKAALNDDTLDESMKEQIRQVLET